MQPIRIKANWFKNEKAKSPEEVASAVAFISFRVAQNVLKSMRKANFDIDAGPVYFDFLSEGLIFCLQLSWRMAHAHFGEEGAAVFMNEASNKAAMHLAENRVDLLADGDVATHKGAFIEGLNASFDDYGRFEYGPEGVSFGFLRYFASRISALMGEKDERWTWDQVIAIEGPEAASSIAKAFGGLNDTGPRKRRASQTTGE